MSATCPDLPAAVEYLRAHRSHVTFYHEMSAYASAGYPNPLTSDQADAYKILPMLIENCRASWSLIPLELRPEHYLLAADVRSLDHRP